MLSSISWHQFITAILIIALLYYFFVIILYYGKDIAQFSKQGFGKKQPRAMKKVTDKRMISTNADSRSMQNENDPLFPSDVHELMEELKGVFAEASKNGFQKAELLMALAGKARKYAQIKATTLEKAVINHIAAESSLQCNIELSDMDLQQLW